MSQIEGENAREAMSAYLDFFERDDCPPSYQQLANQLGCAKSTAHSRLNKALDQVRDTLDPRYRDLVGEPGPDDE